MADPGNTFLLVTIMALATVLTIFAMRFLAQSRQAKGRTEGEAAWRDLADKSASAQIACAASLAAVEADTAELKSRLAGIEKMLREVG
jgi:hypothetical protein